MDPFEDFPDELITEQALHVYDLPSIASFCQVSKRFNRVICNNEEFWRLKFRQENGNVMSNYRGSWKKLYQEYNAVYTFGNNRVGQLGLGDRKNRSTLTKIEHLKGKFVSCGALHTVIVDPTGDIWVCGSNDSGELGLGDLVERLIPVRIVGLKAQAVSTGFGRTFIIDFDNNVWSFGDNTYGQLGLGDFVGRSSPTKIPNIKAKAVSTGMTHTNIIDLEGNVWLCGNMIAANWYDDQLHVQFPNLHDQIASQRFEGNVNNAIDMARNMSKFLPFVYQFHTNPFLMQGIKAQSIAAGGEFTLVIDEYNDVWGIGDGEFLGINDDQVQFDFKRIPDLKAKAISASGISTAVIDLEGNVWTFGQRANISSDSLVPIQILGVKAVKVARSNYYMYVIDKEGNVWIYGFIARPPPEDVNDIDREGDIYYANTIIHPDHRMTVFDKFTQIPDIKATSIACTLGVVVIIGIRPSSIQ